MLIVDLFAGRAGQGRGEGVNSSRRQLLKYCISLPIAQAAFAAPGLPLTPACGNDSARTPNQTPGPFYTPQSPLKQNLVDDVSEGTSFRFIGTVADRLCQPYDNATVELWHADSAGRYDNNGFRLRGYQVTDAQGGFAFDTIVPGFYPGRTKHFHVRLNTSTGQQLITQIYFPNLAENQRDYFYRRDLEMILSPEGKSGSFGFVM